MTFAVIWLLDVHLYGHIGGGSNIFKMVRTSRVNFRLGLRYPGMLYKILSVDKSRKNFFQFDKKRKGLIFCVSKIASDEVCNSNEKGRVLFGLPIYRIRQCESFLMVIGCRCQLRNVHLSCVNVEEPVLFFQVSKTFRCPLGRPVVNPMAVDQLE